MIDAREASALKLRNAQKEKEIIEKKMISSMSNTNNNDFERESN